MNIKELLNSKRFHFNNKESYTISEVYQIVDDHKNFMGGFVDKKVNEQISSLNAEIEKSKAKVEELANSSKELEELKTKYDESSKKLETYLNQDKQKSAISLLKGKVLPGAEVDAFNLIEKEIKDLEITEENKDEVLNPIVNKLFETKGYLKPGKVVSDDPKILTDEKQAETKTEKENKVINHTPVVNW